MRQGLPPKRHAKKEQHLEQEREKGIHIIRQIDDSMVLQVSFGNGEVINQRIGAERRGEGQCKRQKEKDKQDRKVKGVEAVAGQFVVERLVPRYLLARPVEIDWRGRIGHRRRPDPLWKTS